MVLYLLNLVNRGKILLNLLLKGLIRGVIPFVLLLIISLWNRLQGAVEESRVFFFYGIIAFFLV